jgi:hypothetical protein
MADAVGQKHHTGGRPLKEGKGQLDRKKPLGSRLLFSQEGRRREGERGKKLEGEASEVYREVAREVQKLRRAWARSGCERASGSIEVPLIRIERKPLERRFQIRESGTET